MDERIKRIIILIFSVLFCVGCTLAILYSQGYRFDFRNKKFIKTGGLFLKTIPRQSEVYLDGKFKKKTNILFGEVFFNNLIPRKYKITIQKEGYFPWEKSLEVKSGVVTEAKKIILFPKNLEFLALDSKIKEFTFSPDTKKIALQKINKMGWEVYLFYLRDNSCQKLVTESDLKKIISKKYPSELKLSKIIWSPDSTKIILQLNTKQKTKYFLKDLSNPANEVIYLPHLNNTREVFFNPLNHQELFFIKTINNTPTLFKTKYQENNLPELIATSTVTYTPFSKNIYYLDKRGLLYKIDLTKDRRETLTNFAFSLNKGSKYKIEIIHNELFLRENDVLYRLNPDSRELEKISGAVNKLKISPDSKKLMIANDSEIQIFFLEDILSQQPERKKQEKVFLARFSQKINDIFWLNNDYLIFTTSDKIKISEIDNRDTINIINIAKFENPKIFFNRTNKKLYVLSNGTLYVSETLF